MGRPDNTTFDASTGIKTAVNDPVQTVPERTRFGTALTIRLLSECQVDVYGAELVITKTANEFAATATD